MIDTARGRFAAIEMPAARAIDPRTPALLLPGYTGSKEDFLAVLAPLAAAGHRPVAVDLRGQYETPGSDDPGAYELAGLGADILALVAALGGTAHVVGHSFGGFVARAAACRPATADFATELRSLTLLGSGPGRVTGPATLRNLSMLSVALPQHDMETIWAAKRALERASGEPELARDVEEFLHARFVRTHPQGLAVAAGQLVDPTDRLDELTGIRTPVLVIYGEAEDVWSPADIAAMAARIGARTAVLPGAGHSPAVDDPDATAAALIAFWRGVEG